MAKIGKKSPGGIFGVRMCPVETSGKFNRKQRKRSLQNEFAGLCSSVGAAQD